MCRPRGEAFGEVLPINSGSLLRDYLAHRLYETTTRIVVMVERWDVGARGVTPARRGVRRGAAIGNGSLLVCTP